ALGNMMLFADPPRHGRLRGLVNKAFTPRAVEAMRPYIQALVDRILDEAAPVGGMDVIRDLAYPLPVTVIAEMLGVPVRDRDQFKRWSDDLALILANIISTPDEMERALDGALALGRYMRGIIADLRRNPQENLLCALARVEEEGDRLTEEELRA